MSYDKSLIDKLEALRVGKQGKETCLVNIDYVMEIIRQHTAAPDVVERVAKAICRDDVYLGHTVENNIVETIVKSCWRNFESKAKAAIAAMANDTNSPVCIHSPEDVNNPMGGASDRKDEGLEGAIGTSPPAQTSKISVIDKEANDILNMSDEDVWAAAVREHGSPDAALKEADKIRAIIKRVTDKHCLKIESPIPEPVSVDLEKCAIILASDWDLTTYSKKQEYRMTAKAVLDAAKEQGAQFDYVE
jgi:hypothetical protein